MLEFEWDSVKARSNATKHGIAFEEATTVFQDPLALTVLDDRFEERRFFTIGRSGRDKIVVVAHAERAKESESSAPGRRRVANESNMSKADIPNEVDFRGGKRGVYAARYAAGTNVVLLEADVAQRFKTSEQVNRVLRSFIEAASEIGPARPLTRSSKSRGRPASR